MIEVWCRWLCEKAACRDGLVGYDAAFTRLRSRVQFPVSVLPFLPTNTWHETLYSLWELCFCWAPAQFACCAGTQHAHALWCAISYWKGVWTHMCTNVHGYGHEHIICDTMLANIPPPVTWETHIRLENLFWSTSRGEENPRKWGHNMGTPKYYVIISVLIYIMYVGAHSEGRYRLPDLSGTI